MSNRKRLQDAATFRPVEHLSVDAWADKYRFLASSVAAVPGKFQTSRVEVSRGPMRAVTERGVKTITLKSCTQLFKTTFIENVIGWLVHQRPCPILCAFPKEDLVKSFSKERLTAMVRATPVLQDLLGNVLRNTLDESISFKQFPGGYIAMESVGSAANLAARPIAATLADEIDKFGDLKTEGDPLLLLEERTSTFPNALHVRCCSPTVEGLSRIDNSYKESDMRRAYVPCPHCQHMQVLNFFKIAEGGAYVDWNKSDDGKIHDTTSAALYCESCGAEWTEIQRLQALQSVRWQQTKKFTCCGVEQEPMQTRSWDWDADNLCGYATCTECGKRAVSNQHAGFMASKLYAPSITVATLAEKWIAAKDDLASRQVFINTQLGQTFSAQVGKRVEMHVLSDRREKFPDKLPKEIIRLVAGVDDQHDRLELHVLGVGHPEEFWSVYYEIIPGDPSRPEVWKELDKRLRAGWPSEWGIDFKISGACIDSGGHHTEMVYRFCRERTPRNIWAVKGSSWSKRGDPVWPIPKSRNTRDTGFKPFVIAVNSAKDHLRNSLLQDEVGPGYFHIPLERSEAWLGQLTAEQPVFEKKNGVTTQRWHLPKGRANEAFDTLVYAYAALCGLKAVRHLNMERALLELPSQVEKFKTTGVLEP